MSLCDELVDLSGACLVKAWCRPRCPVRRVGPCVALGAPVGARGCAFFGGAVGEVFGEVFGGTFVGALGGSSVGVVGGALGGSSVGVVGGAFVEMNGGDSVGGGAGEDGGR